MDDFTYTWESSGDEEIYITVGNSSQVPTSKLTPQMLQRRVHPLILAGYMGKRPFKDMPPLIELVTDMETCWDLDKAANDQSSNIGQQWRFQDWSQANKYYKYAFQGQIGNFAVRADPFPLRFNKVSATKFQLVLPYKNQSFTQGIGSVPNADYERAQYQFSLIWHRRAIQALVASAKSVNPMMAFAPRDFGGKWQFVMDNLGADQRGCVIENKRRNKGQFIADFKLAIKPQYVEFAELIFHKREPAPVVVVNTAASDPGYPTQDYNSANAACPNVQVFTPQFTTGGVYQINANTVTCNDVPIVHATVGGVGVSTLTALVNDLNSKVSILGQWAVSGNDITLTGAPCAGVTVPFVTT
jgi:hypothetical protein